jgi:dienelactone hydrolase
MRLFERMSVLLMLPCIAWLVHPQWPVWMSWSLLAAAAILALHAGFEGTHWQMWPAYAAAVILAPAGLHLLQNNMIRLSTAFVASFLLACSLVFSWALPMFKLPRPTGDYPIGTRILSLEDPSRPEMHPWAHPANREVIVQLWYPTMIKKGPKAKYRKKTETSFRSSYQTVLDTCAFENAPVAAGSFPVIVHNHAWHGSRHRATCMLQELASHGFVVAAISHPYNSSLVELNGGRIATADLGQDLGFSLHHYIPLAARISLAEAEVKIQTADCRFVLDKLDEFNVTAGHPLEGHLQMERVGGHGVSFGGGVSLELANEDSRVCSVLALDGVVHGKTAVEGLDKPVLLIDSEWMVTINQVAPDAQKRDVETTKLWNDIAETKDRLLTKCGGIRVVIDGAGHDDFSDQVFMSPLQKLTHAGNVPARRLANILNTYSVAFFKKTLSERDQPVLREDAGAFQEANLKVWVAAGERVCA